MTDKTPDPRETLTFNRFCARRCLVLVSLLMVQVSPAFSQEVMKCATAAGANVACGSIIKTLSWAISNTNQPILKGSYTWNMTALVNTTIDPKMDNTTWNLANGFNSGPITAQVKAPSSISQTGATSSATKWASKAGTATLSSTLQVAWYDMVPASGLVLAFAKSTWDNSLDVPVGKLTGYIPQTATGGGIVNIGGGKASGSGKLTAGTTVLDPILISVTNLSNNHTVIQELYSSTFQTTGAAQLTSDANELLLSVPDDRTSSASISLDFPSKWITNSALVRSSVSLKNGIFSATGLFAGLPWIVTPTSAFLNEGLLYNVAIPYQIPPSVLGSNPVYAETLDDTILGSASVSTAVPELPSWAMLLIGLASLRFSGYFYQKKSARHPPNS